MNSRILFGIFIIGLLCSLLLYSGCVKKKYSDLDARASADWIKDAVIYEVYLRSFSKEGTFKSLEARIPELKKNGITVVSLMPIHPIGELNRKGKLGSPYAVKDFFAVNPEYGTSNDFQSLVNSLHRQGMKIIIDLVAHYAAWDSQFLMEHPDWFQQNEEGALVSPSLDLYDVAQIDYRQHEPRKYMVAVMKYWVKEFDIDGFKCTMTESIPLDFWKSARKEMEKIKPVMMISEFSQPEYHVNVFDLTYSWGIPYIFLSIVNHTASASVFDDSLKFESSQFPKGSLRLRFSNTKEINEGTQTNINLNPHEIKTIAVLKFTIPGVPSIYNGEEVGIIRSLNLFEKDEINWSEGKDIIELYKQLGVLRRDHPALRHGLYSSISNSESKIIYSFMRWFGSDSLITIVNFGNEEKNILLKMPSGSSLMWKDQFSSTYVQAKDSSLNITLLPLSYAILVPETKMSSQ
jgi:cyclomaltodextrinase / maltogenic alpha-amylase / neopullulanase